MLDLCPRFILKKIPVTNKKYLSYIITAAIVALVALLYNSGYLQQFEIFNSGYSLTGKIRKLSHYGGRCPLCGGTRSFLFFSSGNFFEALHYSLLGSILFIVTYLFLPVRFFILLQVRSSLTRKVKSFDRWIQDKFLYIVGLLYILQLILHHLDIFVWKA